MFFPTHIFFLQLPAEAFCGDKALKARAPSEGAPHAMAGFVPSLLAALGSGLLQTPLLRFLASSLARCHGSHTEDTASSCTAVALSATLCISLIAGTDRGFFRWSKECPESTTGGSGQGVPPLHRMRASESTSTGPKRAVAAVGSTFGSVKKSKNPCRKRGFL